MPQKVFLSTRRSQVQSHKQEDRVKEKYEIAGAVSILHDSEGNAEWLTFGELQTPTNFRLSRRPTGVKLNRR